MRKAIVVCLLVLCYTAVTKAQSAFYKSAAIQTISLLFADSAWDYSLDTAKAGKDAEVMAKWVRINGTYFDSVGVKYKGSSSYDPNYNKNPLHIELNTFKDQNYQGFVDLKLNNCYADPSMIREVLAYDICRQYLDAPQANFAKVYINGKYKGLYTNAESVNNTFLNNHFYSKSGTFVKCNPNLTPSPAVKSNLKYLASSDSSAYYNYYEMKSDYGWKSLQALCDTLSNKPSALEKIMDVDRAIWMLAFNTILVNLDSYNGAFAQNYYLYKDQTGRFNPIMWDLNMSFGGFPFLGNSNSSLASLSISNMQNLPLNIHATDPYWPLINAIQNNAQYKKMYIAHAKTILSENFSNGAYLNSCGSYRSLIDSAVYYDNNKFYTYSQFQNALNLDISVGSYSVPGIQNLMQTRSNVLLAGADFALASPTISTQGIGVSTPAFNAALILTVSVSNATAVWLAYRLSKTEPFSKQAMYDDGAHNDGSASDGIYGASFILGSNMAQYYFYAENNQAGIFSPQRAEKEFYTIRLYPSPQAGEITINEFLADNKSDVKNEYHLSEDWIELYNNSKNRLSLEGLFLSDDQSNRPLYAFPKGSSIAPEGFVTIWADNLQSNTQLHCNFKLNNASGQLVLSDGSYNTLDGFTYSQQVQDVSLGRCPDGYGAFSTTTYPSFGLYNCTTGINNLQKDEIGLVAYPNPVGNKLTLISNKEETQTVEVYDVFGKIKYTGALAGKLDLEVSDWLNGFYFIRSGECTKKIIVEH